MITTQQILTQLGCKKINYSEIQGRIIKGKASNDEEDETPKYRNFGKFKGVNYPSMLCLFFLKSKSDYIKAPDLFKEVREFACEKWTYNALILNIRNLERMGYCKTQEVKKQIKIGQSVKITEFGCNFCKSFFYLEKLLENEKNARKKYVACGRKEGIKKALSESNKPLSVKQLAEKTGISKKHTMVILRGLTKENIVLKLPETKKCSLFKLKQGEICTS